MTNIYLIHLEQGMHTDEIRKLLGAKKVIVIDKRYNSEHLITPDALLCRGDKCTIRNCTNKTEYLVNKIKYLHN